MNDFTEGGLTFSFANGCCDATAFDKWSFIRNQFQSICGGSKAVDFLCIDNDVLWIIEVKDYRRPGSKKPSNLSLDVAKKVRDSIAGLVAAQCNATDQDEKKFARKALRATQLRVVLHVEQPCKASKLFPKAVDPSDLKSKLKKLLKAIDPHPEIVDQNNLKQNMNWTVTG
ncbi:hypothetical protein [Methylohalobius crimeensis]|uniref:hypothetical protein n=1 Tax=Methylohalobius crimeensis TaxID=244365 RepID=UPI0003B727CC|nr:hypothetical protein [Methylohalobius crimeensis]